MYLHSLDRVVWLWHPLLNLYIWLTISSCYSSIPLVFGLIVRDADLSTLCHSWDFFDQHRLLKTFPGPGYIPWEDGVVWLSHPLVNLYVWINISPCYGSIPLGLGLIPRGGGLSTLCHSCGLAFQQRMVKSFCGSSYLHSEDGVIWLWHPLVNLNQWLPISSCYGSIPLDLGLIVRDAGLSTLCHSSGLTCHQSVLKTFPASGYLLSEDGVVRFWHPLPNLYICLTISSGYSSMSLAFRLIVRDGGLSTLCHSCRFVCQQRMLKMSPGPGYSQSEDGVVWLWHPLVNLYVWLTIWSCYGSIPLSLGFIVRDGGFITLCHSSGLACQQRVLKMFPGPGYLQLDDGVVRLRHPLVNLYIWLTISSCYGSSPWAFGLIVRDGVLSTLCHSFGFASQQRVSKRFLAVALSTPRME